MLITIEGSFIGGQLSRTGQLKNLQIKTSDRIQQVKIPKSLRPLLAQVLKSSTNLKLQVKIGHRKFKAIQVFMTVGRQEKTVQSKPQPLTKIQVCSKGSCHKHGSKKLCAGIQTMLQKQDWQDLVVVEEVSCLKECKQAPNVRLKPSGEVCHGASPQKIRQLLESTLGS